MLSRSLKPYDFLTRCSIQTTSTSGSKIILSKYRQLNIFMTWGTIGFLLYTAVILIFRLCHVKTFFFSLQVRNTKALDFCIDFYFTKVRIIQYLRDLRHYQILNICSRDLLRNPRRTLQMLCDFVGVSCYSKFVELATRYLYSKASRSRYLIEWSNEQKEKVMEETQKYSFLKSLFSFDSD